ncbi:aspartyl-phosphate phosphatase Spo0E family protein [Halobacillus yeomjeoni]|uniref:Aspartyl-phosphate phosphatase Spo0E family protein n=1 Tax=Halobacillus yeomjeoni TaxID=311194 RepID=A0A931MX12_9BACI|nr:aspartyl-phosphate phosphatase Spo0E family protein [Halobacillus yeomjeoni]MBH0231734.1 aspartyl-phosphate phosphatase Spo0E family protein [Halobacillus yeomjeoni]MCA0984943.1 aspartyl-phosphate phosphatase Spo0E family protein [Halobacillus yeomjeoni]
MRQISFLVKEIEDCRRKMGVLARTHPLTSSEVLCMSIRLDHLMNEYEEIKEKQQPAVNKTSYC